MQKVLKISVVGAGRVGSAIAYSLFKSGYPVLSVIDKNVKAASRLAVKVKCKKYSYSASDVDKDTELILITTPDDAIGTVAKEISANKKLKFKKLTAVHTSGVHTSDVLKSLTSKGVTAFSLHPVQSFPKNNSLNQLEKSIKGIYFGFEGDKKSFMTASLLAGVLGSKIISIEKKMKPLYHAGCVFASNYFVTNLSIVSEIASVLKVERNWANIFSPLINSTIENALKMSPIESLTGPIERGDVDTIKMHIESLNKYLPHLTMFYLILGLETARLALIKGSLTSEKFNLFMHLAKDAVKNNKKDKK
jgi:predicted short-subunit dehydrogenase-like oxidoreductase (DUF2520 family)